MTAYRRTYRSYYLSRSACFGPALGLPVYGWGYLGRPLAVGGAYAAWWAAAGLGALVLAGLLVIPALVVTVVCFLPDLPKQAVPRTWRAGYRYRHGRKGAKSGHITDKLRRTVYTADRHRCVYCGSRSGLQVDHRIPWAWGGLTILWNCFTLCGDCNVRKLDYWEQHGKPRHSRHFNPVNAGLAHRIFRRETWRRWNPLRMFRIAWALGT